MVFVAYQTTGTAKRPTPISREVHALQGHGPSLYLFSVLEIGGFVI